VRYSRPIAVAAVACICYLNTLPNDYCYDDVPIVAENPLVQAPGRWADVWTSDYWQATEAEWPSRDLLYRPVSISSYRLVRTVAGPGALPQHAANILLHAMTSGLLVVLCRRLGLSNRSAVAAGLIFAIMPIHSEAVASVVGRADILVALFMIIALLAHSEARHAKSSRPAWSWYACAASAAFLAVGSKESGAAIFPLLVIWDLVLTRPKTQPASAGGVFGRRLAALAYLSAPLLLYLVLRYNALGGQLLSQPELTKTVNVLVDAPAWQRSLGVVQAWGMYWAKTFWPGTLCINYSINAVRLATSVHDTHVLLGLAALAALAGIMAWAAVRGRRQIGFLAVALVLCYLPTSNAVALIQVFFAERTWYVPSIWATILLAWLISPLIARRAWIVVGCIVLLAAAGRVWWRAYDWRENGTLFAAAYEAHPDGVQPLHLYGQWLTGHGQLKEGIGLLERAVTIDPGYTDAHRALVQAYVAADKPAQAIEHAQAAEMQVAGHPPTQQAHAAAAAALAERHRAALDEAYATATSNPADLHAQLRLVRLLRDLGSVSEAHQLMESQDELFADRATWQAEFAVNLVLLNRVDEAVVRYRTSLALAEDSQTAVELAMLLLERRATEDLVAADRLSSLALALAPNSPHALACRAEVLAVQGQIGAAHVSYRKAISLLAPDDPRRQQFIERATALGLSGVE
jgi:tetratricopeptide (TPR) repeat protein